MPRHHRRSAASAGRSQRQLRVGEELRHALSRILGRHELRDPTLQEAAITVTEVQVSPDLRNATAFVMPLGGAHQAEVMAALSRGAAFLRGVLSREVPLRFAPTLRFALDTSFDQASRIAAVLHQPKVERDLMREPPAGKDGEGDEGDGA